MKVLQWMLKRTCPSYVYSKCDIWQCFCVPLPILPFELCISRRRRCMAYSVEVMLPVDMEHVAGASMYEEYGGHLQFCVVIERGDSAGTFLSTIFSFLEESREHLGISEYSVCQTTLEQLFVAISRQENTFIIVFGKCGALENSSIIC